MAKNKPTPAAERILDAVDDAIDAAQQPAAEEVKEEAQAVKAEESAKPAAVQPVVPIAPPSRAQSDAVLRTCPSCGRRSPLSVDGKTGEVRCRCGSAYL